MNELCAKTAEGYMITIDQKKFDGKEINDQSGIAIGHTVKGFAGKATLSKEVEKIFNKVC